MPIFRKLISIDTGILVHLWSFPANKSFEIHFLYLRHWCPDYSPCSVLKNHEAISPMKTDQVYLPHAQKDIWHF